MILPDIRKCPKSDQIMGANRYSCCKSLGAIRQSLWPKNSHNMAIFPYFFYLFGHFFGCQDHIYASIQRRANPDTPDTCGVKVWGHFCLLRSHLWRRRGPKQSYFGVKIGLLWQACYGVRTPTGNRFMSHITSNYMTQHDFGPFLPSPGTFMAQEGSKIWLFWG